MADPQFAHTLRRLASAKINLHLRIGPPRPDGFHPLLSWFMRVGLHDTLEITLSPAGEDRIVLSCSDPDLPTDGRNLVVKAARLFYETIPRSQPSGCRIQLTKRTPSGGGLGGGSSDAAETLLMLATLHGFNAVDRLVPLAAQLGSDVPFFLFGPSSICTGRGEVVRPMPPPTRIRAAVLLLPPIAMPTADVYRRFDAMKLGRDADVSDEPDWAAWREMPATALLPLLVNDLEGPAFSLRPELAAMRNAAAGLLGRPVRMSGSGSTLFTLFDDPAEAEHAARRVQDSLSVATRAVALGGVTPVEGAA